MFSEELEFAGKSASCELLSGNSMNDYVND
jgi:hypothetical protein